MEQQSTAGTAMMKSVALPMPSSSFVTLPPNRLHKTFQWQYDPEFLPLVSTFVLYMAKDPGVPIWSTNTGTALSFALSMTNWPVSAYWVVSAEDTNGVESLPSNEIHFPGSVSDHYRLSWTSNWDEATIYTSTNAALPKEQWQPVANVFSENTYEGLLDFSPGLRVFCLDKPDVLTITLFNPTP